MDAPATPTCDAALRFQPDSAAGTACTKCLQTNCASELTACQSDCLCASSVECLAVNQFSYSQACTSAMSAIFAQDPGLTNVQGCMTQKCALCTGSGD